jgi:hypothetical protein
MNSVSSGSTQQHAPRYTTFPTLTRRPSAQVDASAPSECATIA